MTWQSARAWRSMVKLMVKRTGAGCDLAEGQGALLPHLQLRSLLDGGGQFGARGCLTRARVFEPPRRVLHCSLFRVCG